MWRFGLTTSNVPSLFIVQTVPSELVHVPVSAAGPERGVVTQALSNTSKRLAKTIRKKDCIFMWASCLVAAQPVKLRPQRKASICRLQVLGGTAARYQDFAAKRSVAKGFAFEVEHKYTLIFVCDLR